MKENLAIIFGGESSEHDVSIISALQAIENVDENYYNIIPIYINKKGEWLTGKSLLNLQNFSENKLKNLKQVCFSLGKNCLLIKICGVFVKYKKIDVALTILHGANGEDGKVMALLSLSKIPFTSPDIVESGVCFDKTIFKNFVKGLNVPTCNSVSICDSEYFSNPEKVVKQIENDISYPLICKPAKQGSSIGISVCKGNLELKKALELSFKLGNKTLIEKYMQNIREFNIALIKNGNDIEFSEIEEPIKKSEILSFENKYLNKSSSLDGVDRIIPAILDDKDKEKIFDISKKVYLSLGLKGVVRFDFIKYENEIYINEVNTIPGSLAFYLFREKEITYKKLINLLLKEAYLSFENEKSKQLIYNSNILQNVGLGIKK